jgi:molecular chaperone GrpE
MADDQAQVGPEERGAEGGSGDEPRPAAVAGPFPTPGDAETDELVAVPDTVEEALASVEGDLDALAAAEAERDDYLDALRRLQADFDNYRKRTLKQQTDLVERAAQGLVEKLLPVLDAADLAIAHGAGEAVVQVAGLLMDTLAKEGLDGIDPKPGEPFDPTIHEAVAHEPGDVEHQEIADLLRAGYRWKGVMLRPAMVKVRG